jgi:predicted metal-dependent hydrolase
LVRAKGLSRTRPDEKPTPQNSRNEVSLMAGGRPRTVSATIRVGTERIHVTVNFAKRRRLYLLVNPDQSVVVKAPHRVALADVMDFVRSRARWIAKHRGRFAKSQVISLASKYVDGEQVLYLGRRYSLRIVQAAEADAKLQGRCLSVYVDDVGNSELIEALVEWWYDGHARKILPARLDKCFASVPQLMIEYPELRLRRMTRSWGTCSAKGWINLNWELVKTPLACVDYVIMHELCHLRHRNHSKAFYAACLIGASANSSWTAT